MCLVCKVHFENAPVPDPASSERFFLWCTLDNKYTEVYRSSSAQARELVGSHSEGCCASFALGGMEVRGDCRLQVWLHRTKRAYPASTLDESKDELFGYVWFHTAFVSLDGGSLEPLAHGY